MPIKKEDEKILYDALLGNRDVLGDLGTINVDIHQSAKNIAEYCYENNIQIAVTQPKKSIRDKTQFKMLTDREAILEALLKNEGNLNFGSFGVEKDSFAIKMRDVDPKHSKNLKTLLKVLSDHKNKKQPLATWDTADGKAIMEGIQAFKNRCIAENITLSELKKLAGPLFRKEKEGDLPSPTKAEMNRVFGETLGKELSLKQKQQFVLQAIQYYEKISAKPAAIHPATPEAPRISAQTIAAEPVKSDSAPISVTPFPKAPEAAVTPPAEDVSISAHEPVVPQATAATPRKTSIAGSPLQQSRELSAEIPTAEQTEITSLKVPLKTRMAAVRRAPTTTALGKKQAAKVADAQATPQATVTEKTMEPAKPILPDPEEQSAPTQQEPVKAEATEKVPTKQERNEAEEFLAQIYGLGEEVARGQPEKISTEEHNPLEKEMGADIEAGFKEQNRLSQERKLQEREAKIAIEIAGTEKFLLQHEKDVAVREARKINETQQTKEREIKRFLDIYPPHKIEEQYQSARKQSTGKAIASFFGHHGRDSQKIRLSNLKAALGDLAEYSKTKKYKDPATMKKAADHLGNILLRALTEIKEEDKKKKFQLGDSALEKICRNMLVDLDKIYPQPELLKPSAPKQK